MATKLVQYVPTRDFRRVRDMLASSYRAYDRPQNWRIERWNYARYFVAPMKDCSGVEDGLHAIRRWEENIGVWEDGAGEIVGVALSEHARLGVGFLQRRPGYDGLLPEMLDYAEMRLLAPGTPTFEINAYEHDEALQALARARGYCRAVDYPNWDAEYEIGALPRANLPAGYALRSMAQEHNIERRREVVGRAYNHADPARWPSAFSYRMLQRAPDYRPDLDLYVVGPRGQYVSCCIAWYDEHNHLGSLEPVGTHPDYRRRGFGRAIVMEAIRRLAALGATRVQVGSCQAFYEALGFRKRWASYRWVKAVGARELAGVHGNSYCAPARA